MDGGGATRAVHLWVVAAQRLRATARRASRQRPGARCHALLGCHMGVTKRISGGELGKSSGNLSVALRKPPSLQRRHGRGVARGTAARLVAAARAEAARRDSTPCDTADGWHQHHMLHAARGSAAPRNSQERARRPNNQNLPLKEVVVLGAHRNALRWALHQLCSAGGGRRRGERVRLQSLVVVAACPAGPIERHGLALPRGAARKRQMRVGAAVTQRVQRAGR